jgi:predicted membrane protein
MPIGTSLSILPVLLAAMSIPTLTVAAVKGPAADDIYSVMGAVLAAILALMDAVQKRRDHFHAASTFLGSSVIGALAPGPVYHLLSHIKLIPSDAVLFSLWQTWAIAGFFFGLNGWFLIHKTNDRIREFIDRFKKT